MPEQGGYNQSGALSRQGRPLVTPLTPISSPRAKNVSRDARGYVPGIPHTLTLIYFILLSPHITPCLCSRPPFVPSGAPAPQKTAFVSSFLSPLSTEIKSQLPSLFYFSSALGRGWGASLPSQPLKEISLSLPSPRPGGGWKLPEHI